MQNDGLGILLWSRYHVLLSSAGFKKHLGQVFIFGPGFIFIRWQCRPFRDPVSVKVHTSARPPVVCALRLALRLFRRPCVPTAGSLYVRDLCGGSMLFILEIGSHNQKNNHATAVNVWMKAHNCSTRQQLIMPFHFCETTNLQEHHKTCTCL